MESCRCSCAVIRSMPNSVKMHLKMFQVVFLPKDWKPVWNCSTPGSRKTPETTLMEENNSSCKYLQYVYTVNKSSTYYILTWQGFNPISIFFQVRSIWVSFQCRSSISILQNTPQKNGSFRILFFMPVSHNFRSFPASWYINSFRPWNKIFMRQKRSQWHLGWSRFGSWAPRLL